MRSKVGDKIYVHNGELTYEALVVDATEKEIAVCLTTQGLPIYFSAESTKSSGGRFSMGVLPGSLVVFYGGSFLRLGEGQTRIPANRDVSR